MLAKGATTIKKEDTKSRILTEALRLFAQRGYDAVSVEQIANAVSVCCREGRYLKQVRIR